MPIKGTVDFYNSWSSCSVFFYLGKDKSVFQHHFCDAEIRRKQNVLMQLFSASHLLLWVELFVFPHDVKALQEWEPLN